MNRTRSANDPVISAGVMIANFSWNSAKTISGIVGASAASVPAPTRLNMKNVAGLPMMPWMLSPNARLKPTTTHRMLMTAIATTLCSIVDTTFLVRTIPP